MVEKRLGGVSGNLIQRLFRVVIWCLEHGWEISQHEELRGCWFGQDWTADQEAPQEVSRCVQCYDHTQGRHSLPDPHSRLLRVKYEVRFAPEQSYRNEGQNVELHQRVRRPESSVKDLDNGHVQGRCPHAFWLLWVSLRSRAKNLSIQRVRGKCVTAECTRACMWQLLSDSDLWPPRGPHSLRQSDELWPGRYLANDSQVEPARRPSQCGEPHSRYLHLIELVLVNPRLVLPR